VSFLLVEELFDVGDDRFLGELLTCDESGRLKGFASRWYADTRPFARRTLGEYVDHGCDRAGHRPLVKALFKLAESAGDDALMSRFLVAFDRLPRRVIVTEHRYDWQTRTATSERKLRRDYRIPSNTDVAAATGRFTHATRQYLARRAWRYFRTLGFRDASRYGRAVRDALSRYEDASLDRPERLLDAWGLVNALYWGSPVLDRDPRGARVAEGRALTELEPAPFQPAAWRGCYDGVLDLVRHARGRTVRAWAVRLLERDYAAELAAMPAREAARLLLAGNDEAEALGISRLRAAADAATLPVDVWLDLLRGENLDVLSSVCELAAEHLDPSRLSLDECVALARAPLAPVAELGLRWVREREVTTPGDLSRVVALRDALAPSVRADAARYLRELLETSPHATVEHARDVVDSRFADVRAEGLALAEKGARFGDDVSLAAALAESPYDDARAHLVRRLDEWREAPDSDAVRRVWAAALFAVHRGGSVKREVLEQISARLASHPDEARDLLPILAVALRSVRPAERRAALAAVTKAAVRTPGLVPEIARAIPELGLPDPKEVSA
jgi:hypothetical protein